MIVDAVVGLVVGLLRALLSLVPDWAPPAGSGNWPAYAGTLVGILAGYFPLTALGSSVIAVYALRILTSLWGVLLFIYDRFPFKAT